MEIAGETSTCFSACLLPLISRGSKLSMGQGALQKRAEKHPRFDDVVDENGTARRPEGCEWLGQGQARTGGGPRNAQGGIVFARTGTHSTMRNTWPGSRAVAVGLDAPKTADIIAETRAAVDMESLIRKDRAGSGAGCCAANSEILNCTKSKSFCRCLASHDVLITTKFARTGRFSIPIAFWCFFVPGSPPKRPFL